MGANFCTMTLDGRLTKDQVRVEFEVRQDQDGHDHGRGGYSGSFYEARGLRFTDRIFETHDEAYEYLENTAQKWEAALAVRHKAYEMPKSVLNHDKARRMLYEKIWLAESNLRHALQKMKVNNRSTKPSYVTTAEKKLERVKASVQPKIDDRTAKIQAGIRNAAAKSNKWVWLIGALCSS